MGLLKYIIFIFNTNKKKMFVFEYAYTFKVFSFTFETNEGKLNLFNNSFRAIWSTITECKFEFDLVSTSQWSLIKIKIKNSIPTNSIHRLMFTLSILNLLSITVQKVILYFILPTASVFAGFQLAWFNRDSRLLGFKNI